MQRAEYEDLAMICFQCGRYGHVSEVCKEGINNQAMAVEEDCMVTDNHTVSTDMAAGMSRDGKERGSDNGGLSLGPWMHAPKRGKK